MKHPKDVPGNVIATAAAHERFLTQLGAGWVGVVEGARSLAGHDVYIESMTIRGSIGEGGDLLIVIRAISDEGKVVAFHNVDDSTTMWVGLANRMRNGSIKWKEDQYG